MYTYLYTDAYMCNLASCAKLSSTSLVNTAARIEQMFIHCSCPRRSL